MSKLMRALANEYFEKGFVYGVDAFSTEVMAGYRVQFDALEQELGEEKCQVGLLDWHYKERFVWELATAPKVIDAIQAIMGDDIMLLATHFFCKYPEKEPKSFVAWHQDVTYWGLEPAEAHTAWIAIDDADPENGSMLAIPCSHKKGILAHGASKTEGNLLSINQEVPNELVNEQTAVHLNLRAGQMSIHHGMTLHASQPNRSQRRRCGLTVRYIHPRTKQVKLNSQGKKYSPILVRGEDHYHHFPETDVPFSLALR